MPRLPARVAMRADQPRPAIEAQLAPVAAPRIHSQLWPDQISLEEGISPDTRRLLEAMGHTLVTVPAMGSANSVEVVPARAPATLHGSTDGHLVIGGSLGVADPRRRDAAAVPERP